ncbi:NADH:ubiquinone oxidoreductase subunit J [Iodidimonas muriae]|uniref:NADH-quinone oxidoreductase subunit J n=1 Tax=Iodidimonas muriae TaxID=261467 RepID=A0ABQ2L7H9_9PROT|nr:NADH-quinone oxidoreductase subunit J [Iodidimonas muriae]GER08403.1 NADH:ubiquinone oxidoreductase subunit J [Kordiimonadales bacterium JCM 17843]GGO05936.1 NADH:ubiquinone oxidoreductase subunit J [Iodidimonas muriae]
MSLTALAFYLFASITVFSGFMVIASKNPVHSVLFLILAFFNASGLFLLLGAEFLAMLLIIIYVGAVAVLFLFVVMMLDINYTEMREGFLQYLPIGALIGLIVLVELIMVVGVWQVAPEIIGTPAVAAAPDLTNTEALGAVLYTQYIYAFQAAGIVLLIAMIGAIVLTLRTREGVKRQNISQQNRRTPQTAIEIKKVKVGEGL